jgi:hypothetical protein
MKPLIEELHDNNVIFSYYGFIDSSVLHEVLQITKSKLEGNNESGTTVMKVHDAINVCVDNIIKHNFYPDDARVRYKSLLVVSKHGSQYEIDTINVVNTIQKQSIDKQLNLIVNRSREELIAMKNGLSKNENTIVVPGNGLLDLVLAADKCDCTFKNLDAHHLFNINYKVNSYV